MYAYIYKLYVLTINGYHRIVWMLCLLNPHTQHQIKSKILLGYICPTSNANFVFYALKVSWGIGIIGSQILRGLVAQEPFPPKKGGGAKGIRRRAKLCVTMNIFVNLLYISRHLLLNIFVLRLLHKTTCNNIANYCDFPHNN